MYLWLYSVILSLVFSLGSLAQAKQSLPPKSAKIPTFSKQVRSLAPFSQIEVKGRINVQLHTGYKKPQIILKGDNRDLDQVHTIVKSGKLHLMLEPSYPAFGEAITVEIKASSLSSFKFTGRGDITGNRLYANALDLTIDNQGNTTLGGSLGLRQVNLSGSGLIELKGAYSPYLELHITGNENVQLYGPVHLACLDFNGNGSFKLQGIHSDALKIRASGGANILLSGLVNHLDVELWNHAYFRGAYLSAQRSFIKTHDRAVAEISSINHQSTLATDASDIFYYTLPLTRADFMALNGSVLDMRDRHDPFFCNYSPYNKHVP